MVVWKQIFYYLGAVSDVALYSLVILFKDLDLVRIVHCLDRIESKLVVLNRNLMVLRLKMVDAVLKILDEGQVPVDRWAYLTLELIVAEVRETNERFLLCALVDSFCVGQR